MKKDINKEALKYHMEGRPGKIEVVASKPCKTQWDLSLAYTPGVAQPCREIERDPSTAALYTARANLVAVITNGTAVLGLGDIGPLAGKPVMEGKGILFKRFADVDVFDIEIAEKDPDKLIETIKRLEPTFGGINLEDIKSPECFHIEETLIKAMGIPVFHDDQHGTAIITAAGLMNAVEVVGKKMDNIKIVFSGAGAAAVSCARHLLEFGVKKEQIWMCDKNGLVTPERKCEKYRAQFEKTTNLRTLAEVVRGADVFIGLSVKGVMSREMVASMAPNPIIFAMANPDPEIMPEDVYAVRKDAIVATGRSDYPNQVNNVLGFPFIFRGALDVGARVINKQMKVAASIALASLAKKPVPKEVLKAYKIKSLKFGRDYIIPKPLDPRVCIFEATAVAKAAVDSGVATKPIKDWEKYKKALKKRLGI